MTPQERELVAERFDRLTALEGAPRDGDAERAIAEGLGRAPHAIYPLVQTVLVQDEALRAADTRIRELEAAAGPEPDEGRTGAGFLDTMRGSRFGPRPRSGGSVPSVRPADAGADTGFRSEPDAPMPHGALGTGGSFLGTAAAAAAGMVGGALLLGGVHSMLGGHHGSTFGGQSDQSGSGIAHDPASPWGGGDLARQAGLDDVGRGPSTDVADDRDAGRFDVAGNETDDQSFDDGFDGGFDSDVG